MKKILALTSLLPALAFAGEVTISGPVSGGKVDVVATVAAGGNPCVSPSATLVSVTGATSGTTPVQIAALSTGKKFYICSLTVIGVSGSASPTFSLMTGTGSNCASTQATIVQAWVVGTALWSFAHPVAVSAASQALCYVQTGTSPVANYQLTYVLQ